MLSHMINFRASLSPVKIFGQGRYSFPALPFIIAVLVVLPVAVVASSLLSPTREVWLHLWNTLLPEMLRNTIILLAGVGIGTFILGAGLAWLVVAYRFPGRSVFEWLFVLPMAVPTYIMGFVYMSTFDFAGPVQSFLRQHLGVLHWFPEIRSGGGAILVMTLALYPYVYMLAKAGFQGLSSNTFEAARVMGYGSGSVFVRIALPLARPAIAGGLVLALMEALADFATVRFFNFLTLADGVMRIWFGMMDMRAATELAGLLAFFALAVILFEQALRGRSRYYQAGGKAPGVPPIELAGWQKWAATGISLLVVGVAFGIPMFQLLSWSAAEIKLMPAGAAEVYLELISNSLLLAGLAAFFAVITALILASGVRTKGGATARMLGRLATTGYAIPGAVVAVGILVTVAAFDHAINDMLDKWWGISIGLILTGSLVGLIYGYVVRFMAVAYNSVDAGLEKITPNITMSARMLQAGSWRILWRIHLPLITPGIFAGAVLVFVDVMKELPVTLMLRPFGYDTLAVWVWQMAAESMWSGAAIPAVAIVLTGIVPVILLTRAVGRK